MDKKMLRDVGRVRRKTKEMAVPKEDGGHRKKTGRARKREQFNKKFRSGVPKPEKRVLLLVMAEEKTRQRVRREKWREIREAEPEWVRRARHRVKTREKLAEMKKTWASDPEASNWVEGINLPLEASEYNDLVVEGRLLADLARVANDKRVP